MTCFFLPSIAFWGQIASIVGDLIKSCVISSKGKHSESYHESLESINFLFNGMHGWF